MNNYSAAIIFRMSIYTENFTQGLRKKRPDMPVPSHGISTAIFFDQLQEFLKIKRLGDKLIYGAWLLKSRISFRLPAGNEDNRRFRFLFLDAEGNIQTVHHRHAMIGDNKVKIVFPETAYTFLAIARLSHGMACIFENMSQQASDKRFIIYEQYSQV